MFLTIHPALLAQCATFHEEAAFPVRAEVAIERHAHFDVGETPNQRLTSPATLIVLFLIVDEIGLVESTFRLGVGGF